MVSMQVEAAGCVIVGGRQWRREGGVSCAGAAASELWPVA